MSQAPDFGEQSYRGTGKLEGRKAIITGGDSGIGRAVALAFAREGADVAISYLEAEQSDADETARVVREAGRTALQLPGDLQDSGYCRSAGRAGGRRSSAASTSSSTTPPIRWRATGSPRSPRTSWTGRSAPTSSRCSTLCKAALDAHAAGRDDHQHRVDPGLPADPMLLAYAATKAAIVNFTKGLAQEAIEKGIRVNAVAPGPIWTPLIPATMPEEKVEDFGAEESPMGRAGQPAEVGAGEDSPGAPFAISRRLGPAGG